MLTRCWAALHMWASFPDNKPVRGILLLYPLCGCRLCGQRRLTTRGWGEDWALEELQPGFCWYGPGSCRNSQRMGVAGVRGAGRWEQDAGGGRLVQRSTLCGGGRRTDVVVPYRLPYSLRGPEQPCLVCGSQERWEMNIHWAGRALEWLMGSTTSTLRHGDGDWPLDDLPTVYQVLLVTGSSLWFSRGLNSTCPPHPYQVVQHDLSKS